MQKVLPSIFRNLEKLRKYPVIFGDLRRLSQVFGSFRAIFGNLRKFSGNLWKSSEVFGRSSEIFGRFCVVFGNPRKCSGDLRWSSKYIGLPLSVFVLTSDIFDVICTVTLLCTMLTKNALLFSQSELSNFFKCIINCITCTLCNKLYIGKTGRRLGDRFRKHLRDVEKNDKDASKPVSRSSF